MSSAHQTQDLSPNPNINGESPSKKVAVNTRLLNLLAQLKEADQRLAQLENGGEPKCSKPNSL